MTLRDLSKDYGVPATVAVSCLVLGWLGSQWESGMRKTVEGAVTSMQASQKDSVAEMKGAHREIQHEVSLLRVDVQALSRLVDGGMTAVQFGAWVRELRARLRAVPGIGADLEAAVPDPPGK